MNQELQLGHFMKPGYRSSFPDILGFGWGIRSDILAGDSTEDIIKVTSSVCPAADLPHLLISTFQLQSLDPKLRNDSSQ